MQDQLLTLLSSSQQPSSPGGGGGGGGSLGSHLGSSPPSIFTTRQTSLLPTLSKAHHLPSVSLMSGHFECILGLGDIWEYINVATLQALRLAPSLCLVPPRWVCCPAAGRNLDFSPAPQPASPTGRRNLPCSVTNSLGLRSLLSDNLSLDTGDQKILHFVKFYKTDVG